MLNMNIRGKDGLKNENKNFLIIWIEKNILFDSFFFFFNWLKLIWEIKEFYRDHKNYFEKKLLIFIKKLR